MQNNSMSKNSRLPYSAWKKHRASNGLIYLSHPGTGEVKWLWSRHQDPKTKSYYLANTVTGERQWVTAENAHLSPATSQSTASSETSDAALGAKPTNPFSNIPKSPGKADAPVLKQLASHSKSSYREIAAPRSLGLTADEVLMLVPETGRRYIFNKKTKNSRWLPNRKPDTIPVEVSSKGVFGHSRNKNAPRFVHDRSREDTALDNIGGADVHHEASQSMLHSLPTLSPKISGEVSRDYDSPTQRHIVHSNFPVGSSAKSPQSNMGVKMPRFSAEEAARIIQASLRFELSRRADILNKLRVLTSVFEGVENITTAGKYDMMEMRDVADSSTNSEEKNDAAQRLLELGEYLTQQMLKVDDVVSAGNQLVRAKRKQTVNVILGLTDEIDVLRKRLKIL